MKDNPDPHQSVSAPQPDLEPILKKARRNPPSDPITHLKHWQKRIFKPKFSRNGVQHESVLWAVEIQFAGERRRWSLGTPNASAAAARALEIYKFLYAHGWEETEREFQKKTVAKKKDLTIGQYVEAVCEVVPTTKTLCGYIAALRKIAADVAGIDGGKAKHDYRGGGRDRWLERVNSTKLSALTPEALQKWKVAFLKRAGTDESARRSARTSINSYLRCARSLFQAEIIKHLKSLELPNPLPFAGVKLEPKPSSKYYGTFDLEKLISKARDELAVEHPAQFAALLLCGMAGLRRREADLLEWDSLRWDEGVIRVKTTKHFAGKTEDSHADIMVDRELLEYLRGCRPKASGPFVIKAPGREPKSVNYAFYRCAPHFEALIGWL
jgi:hypothetical protein